MTAVQHTTMCLSSLARVRHWSCPECLPTSDTEELQVLLPTKAKEAEWCAPRTPGRALWEEKVLSTRGNRVNKHREALGRRQEELMEKKTTVKEETLEERLLRVFCVSENSDQSSDNFPCGEEALIEEEDEAQGKIGKPTNTGHFQPIEIFLTSSLGSGLEAEPPDREDQKIPLISLTPSSSFSRGGLRDKGSTTPLSHSQDSRSSNCHEQNSSLTEKRALSSYSTSSVGCWLFPQRSQPILHSRTHKGSRPSDCARRRPSRPPWILPLLFLMALLVPAHCIGSVNEEEINNDSPVCPDGIFRGNVEINGKERKMSSLQQYANCSVVEGSISINAAIYKDKDVNYSMPKLREVTDFVLVYRADEIISFKDIFPNLAVIRGHKLVLFYALAIFQNQRMVEIGFSSLTHIMNGGVRIQKNPSLCYTNTIDWEKIVKNQNDHKNIIIDHNGETKVCPTTCPGKCTSNHGKCWNANLCQRMLGICPKGSLTPDAEDRCYVNHNGKIQFACAKECVGGCTERDNGDACWACNHTRHVSQNDPSSFTCRANCPGGFVAYKKWTCIEEHKCSLTPVSDSPFALASREEDNYYKVEDNQCVKKCSSGKESVKINAIWKCQKCTHKCPVSCIGERINSPDSAKKLASCTEVEGDIIISVISAEITSILEQNLQHIEVITGVLKIERSHSLVSLHFFKNLREIRGQGLGAEDSKILTIFENDNLLKLFPDDSKIRLGGLDSKTDQMINPNIFIHYNQKLCTREIDRFLDASNVTSNFREDQFVSKHSNGNRIVCSAEKLDLEVEAGGPKLLRIVIQNYQHKLETSNPDAINALLGYHVYYRELSEVEFADKSMSKYEGMDVCGGSKWKVHFQEHSSKNTNTRSNDPEQAYDENKERRLMENGIVIAIMTYPDITFYIPDCKPYTSYAVYATTVIEKSLAANATGAQSDIVYTRTKESKPDLVHSLTATSENNKTTTSMQVSWQPPRTQNGLIDQYYVVLTYLKLSGERRCGEEKSEKKRPKQSPVVKEQIQLLSEKLTTDGPGNGTCPVCEFCGINEVPSRDPTSRLTPDTTEVHSEMAFYTAIINRIWVINTPGVSYTENDNTMDGITQRRKRSLPTSPALNAVTTSSPPPTSPPVFIKQDDSSQHPRALSTETQRMTVAGRRYINRTFLAVEGNVTTATFTNLIHYGTYEVRVYACLKEQKEESANSTDTTQKFYRVCSNEERENPRSKHRKGMDDIKPFNTYSDESLTSDTNSSMLTIRWRAPVNPNGVVLYYQLGHSTNMEDWSEMCIDLDSLESGEDSVLEWRDKYKKFGQGQYVRVRAVSELGPGAWTTSQWMKAPSNNTAIITAIIICAFITLVAAMAVTSGIVYYKNRRTPAAWLYSERCPDYVDSGEVYTVDDWEVDREKVDIGIELGKGSFGMVYKGLYKNPEGELIHCAIKTVNEQAGLGQKIEFLREANAMKDSNTEHVVKLVGVVSQSQPVLVLMELMENGDLKEYLRKHRPDCELNLPVPSLRQVLEMAADIADGMAYLANKRTVHR